MKKLINSFVFKNKFFYIIILILLIIYTDDIKKLYRTLVKPKSKEDIVRKEKFPKLFISFMKAKKFLKKCLKGILINKNINATETPKISAIINFYNNKKTLSRAIKSIQNQNILDMEIILVNDFSSDNSLSIAQNAQKNDPRIKIINNKKNMGTLFSRSIGVLSSKGKYIFHLDSDDMILDKDVFSSILSIAEKDYFDIVSFKCIYLDYGKNILRNRMSQNRLNFHHNNIVLHQPELGLYPIRPGKHLGTYKKIENYLWSKCIKTKVYQTTLQKMGKEKYSRYMRFEEDRAVLYALFNVAESIKFVGKYGILQIKTHGSMTRRRKKRLERFLCKLYFADIVIDFNKETIQSRKLLVYIITSIINSKDIEYVNRNEYNLKLFISCVDRVLNYKYVSDNDKIIIRKSLSRLKFLKYPT